MDYRLKTHLSACDLIKHGVHIWYVRKLFQEANLDCLQFDAEQALEIAKSNVNQYGQLAGALAQAAGMYDDHNDYGNPWSRGLNQRDSSGEGHGSGMGAYGHAQGMDVGDGCGGGDWVGWFSDDYGAIGKGYGIGDRGGAISGYGNGNAYGHGNRDGMGDGYNNGFGTQNGHNISYGYAYGYSNVDGNGDGNGYCSEFRNGDGYF